MTNFIKFISYKQTWIMYKLPMMYNFQDKAHRYEIELDTSIPPISQLNLLLITSIRININTYFFINVIQQVSFY